MSIDGSVAFKLGCFLRQNLTLTLENHLLLRTFSISLNISHLKETVILSALHTFCDRETSAHAQRMVQLATSTGHALSLSTENIALLRQATLLHDIGKVAIPLAILQKPGTLTARERKIMCLHPTIGKYILLYAGRGFQHLATVVAAHHEHWNGKGYPAGLSGTTIPLLARILAVIDSYDAMTSYRSYGRPLPSQEACQELQCCAGQRYDPHVVTAFLATHHENARSSAFHSSPGFSSSIFRQSHATNGPEQAALMSATPLLQSDEFVPASA